MRWYSRTTVCVGLALTLCLSAAGCGSWRWPGSGTSKSTALKIVPQNNRYSLTSPLTAKDVVTMMLHVGFSEKQILELGESLRNALMTSGAAQVKQGNKVGALFAVFENDCIYITTRASGIYIYDVRNGKFGLGQAPSR
jgi:hypothetical protein